VVNVQIDGTGFIWNGWLLDGADITEYEQGGTNVSRTSMPGMRAGNFSADTTKIKDPITGKQFPGNMIPANRISPQANFFLSYLPTPSQASFSSAQALDIIKGDMKIDAALTGADHLMGRYSIADNQETDPNQFPALKTQALHSRAQNVAFSETHTFGAKWLNEARAGYYRDYFLFSAILAGTDFLSQAGITGYQETQVTPSFPYITMSGYSAFNGSGSGNFPKSNRIRTWQYADTVSYTSGKNEVRFGAQMWVQRHSFYNGQGQEGEFTFTTQYTGDAFGVNGQALVAANPHPGTVCAGTTLVLASCVMPAISTAPQTFNHTYMEQYNFAMQFQLLKDTSLDVAYVGTTLYTGS
jgi:hypothetical protein